ncbi:hypothetical protein PoB_003156500 [Plakobranchus ocellatus]|uniref:Uncharacterized protein n=1 Tax=Plakobranchus ocellatus TaxID=259542 RepID=A0AAV4ACJ5_9GAST|nr:hypothetical protein PoB_003156500 [Plakobranchus ocellatus]
MSVPSPFLLPHTLTTSASRVASGAGNYHKMTGQFMRHGLTTSNKQFDSPRLPILTNNNENGAVGANIAKCTKAYQHQQQLQQQQQQQ